MLSQRLPRDVPDHTIQQYTRSAARKSICIYNVVPIAELYGQK